MPDFWQFPTVSMGIGPLNAIYQARYNRYLHNRGIKDTSDQNVWAFLGDGEMDEVDTLGAIGLASREKLDNLTFVVNCNLQRLDGPVMGNGKIIQELEGTPLTNEKDQPIQCPNCASTDLYSNFKSMKGVKGVISTIISFVLTVFPIYVNIVYRCKHCETEFKKK